MKRKPLKARLVAGLTTLYLCFVFIGSRPYQNELIADSSGQVDSIRQFVVLALALFGFLVFVTEKHRQPASLMALGTVLLYSLFLLSSVLWSDHPGFVVRRAGVFMLVSCSLFVIADYLYREDLLMDTLLVSLLSVFIINVLSMLLLHGISIDHEGNWKGIQIHKNVAGSFSAICAIFFFWLGFLRHRGYWVVCLMAFGFLIMSQSKTSLALFLGTLAIVFFLALLRFLHTRLGGYTTVVGITVGIVLFIVFGSVLSLNSLIEWLYGDITLTGRIFIWDYVLSKHQLRPWLGYGYGSFWGMGALTPAISEGIPLVQDLGQAHNGYLDILIHTGWVGMLLFSSLLSLALYPAIRAVFSSQADLRHVAMLLNIIVFIVLHNVLESTYLNALSVNWTLLFLSSAYVFFNHLNFRESLSRKLTTPKTL